MFKAYSKQDMNTKQEEPVTADKIKATWDKLRRERLHYAYKAAQQSIEREGAFSEEGMSMKAKIEE